MKSDKIDNKITGMATKTDLEKMEKSMASKSDLQSMEASIVKNTKIHISEAVDPLKSEICDLRARVGKIEDQGVSSPAAQTSTITPEIKTMLANLDPAHKRIAFSGFPTSMAQDERTKLIEKFLVGFQNLPKIQNIGLILKGPRNNRQATNISYVEFYSTDDVSEVLVITKGSSFKVGNESITPKRALTKINGSRNWALREAEKMIKAFVGTSPNEVPS